MKTRIEELRELVMHEMAMVGKIYVDRPANGLHELVEHVQAWHAYETELERLESRTKIPA